MVFKIPFGAKTSPYGPYELGYRRATKNFYKVMQSKKELIIKESYKYKIINGLSSEIRRHEEGISSNR